MEASSAERVLNGDTKEPAETFAVLTARQVADGWQYLEPVLAKACEQSNGQMSMQQITQGLASGVCALIAIVSADGDLKALAAIEVRDHERGSALWIVLATGHDAITWSDYDEDLRNIARALGCSVIRVRGRKGWIRTLRHWRWVLELDV